MRESWLVAIIPGGIALIALVMLLVLFLIKLVWAWAVPDIFPGAVKQDYA